MTEREEAIRTIRAFFTAVIGAVPVPMKAVQDTEKAIRVFELEVYKQWAETNEPRPQGVLKEDKPYQCGCGEIHTAGERCGRL